MTTRLLIPLSTVILIASTGCMDGPFYMAKRMNPYFQAQWKEDRELGPTFEDRLEELELLEAQIAAMSPEAQQQWATRLDELIREEASPEMRARAARIVATIPGETAVRALNSASADDVVKVRLAACKAWRSRGDDAAKDMLLSLAAADDNSSVRQSALECLGDFNDPEVLRTLATLTDDNSPAIQYQVAQSLAKLTGENFAGDMVAWREYVQRTVPKSSAGGSVAPENGGGYPVLPASSTGGVQYPSLP